MAAPGSTTTVRPAQVEPVDLADLADILGTTSEEVRGVAVSGLSLSSSGVRPGDLYAALPGSRTHGARYATHAVSAGARAVVTDEEGARILAGIGVPVVVADRPRSLLGRLAAHIYGNPADDLTLVGVTGTHGKTTTTQLVGRALAAAGRTPAVIGTMGTLIAGEPVGGLLTTPEAPDLHALFAVMRERGVEVCAMEVSSHAVVMGRVDGVVFDLAVFTNLGRDHLDFHAGMEDYFQAKAQLFTPDRARRALVNVDDDYGTRLAEAALVPTRTMSTVGSAADWTAVVDTATSTPQGSDFDVRGPEGRAARAHVAMPGIFNVANALAALAICVEVGEELAQVTAGLASDQPVAGRMEPVPTDTGVSVIVDYAHKPDALAAVLAALRPVTRGRLTLVVGAGGDRDRGKRPLMGEVGARLADLLVVTDDNPRSEDPAAIRAEILAGADPVSSSGSVVEIGDRREAIRYAVAEARPGDTVLIAGKGHETGQEIAGEVVPFDDRAEAAAALHAVAERRS